MKFKTQNLQSKKYFLTFSQSAGFTLFYAMLISSLLLAIGLAIFNITYKEFILTSGIRESESAFYAADSALECALYWDFVHDQVSTPAFGFYGDSLASGLVGYWRFEEEPAFQDKAFDSSGQGNVMDVTPISTVRNAGGQIGQSLPFDGMNTFVNASSIRGLSFNDSKEHTISAWIKIPQYPAGKTETEWVLVLGDPADGDGVHRWVIDFSGALSVGDWGGGSVLSSQPLPIGAFTHVAVTYEKDTTLTLYVDGFEVASARGDLFADVFSTPSFTLGEAFVSGGGEMGSDIRFYGELDDVRVYNRALSPEEVLAMANGQSNNIFVEPIGEESEGIELSCARQVINDSDPNIGWVPEGGEGNWKITLPAEPDIGSQTTFDISFDDGTCALVDVFKTVSATGVSSTTVVSRGYNTCDFNNSRRLERAIRAKY